MYIGFFLRQQQVWRIIFTVFLAVFFYAGAASAEPIKVVVFGDSLTSGYKIAPSEAFPDVLERKFKAMGYSDIEVINASVAGETTSGGLERLQSIIDMNPDVVIVELGANDVLRGVSITKIIHPNLYRIIETLKRENIGILLCGMKAPPNMGKQYVSQLDLIYRTYAKDFKIPLYPFFLDGVATNPKYNLADGMHPNADGVKIIVDKIYPYVKPLVDWRIKMRQYEYEQGK